MTTIREKCPDCQVAIGEPHEQGCDVARCMAFGEQRLMHEMVGGRPKVEIIDGMPIPVFDENESHDCGRDAWSGHWPGEMECEEFGWFVQDRCRDGLGWLPVDPSRYGIDFGVMHDLNRLAVDARWDAESGRYQLRGASS